MYFDSACIAKFYINEPESPAIRSLVRASAPISSSAWAVIEVQATFHRLCREGILSEKATSILAKTFQQDSIEGLWTFIPVSASMLWRLGATVASLPKTVFIRSGDAVHLMTAKESGEREIWTNDRHLLAAAPRFGLAGRSVG